VERKEKGPLDQEVEQPWTLKDVSNLTWDSGAETAFPVFHG